ncbi:c-type cytochrome [Qingshengfaniella alkalisoli]|uniref:Cytochrome c n=1 Tax=Qingshengfaniella alkalisoli TaxID=2599296 RepID=A0A5B8JAQ5_9RHOB|nr:c-type cytochrome [Qingshengfaniella alkalisoli]QDY71250.1 cytochrome c [Qingshengfaniella alkalisoli]
MKTAKLLVGAITVAVAGCVFALVRPQAQETKTSEKTADIAAGERIYQQYCATCHGSNLEGQPDWQTPGPDGRLPAPPHDETGHTWHHAPEMLFTYTKFGGAALMKQQGLDMVSGMPGFEGVLSDAEIRNTLAFIESTWSDRVRVMRSERFGTGQ